MPLNRFGRYLWLFVVGAVLALAGVLLAIFRPAGVPVFLLSLPTVYAASLAGFFSWIRARRTVNRERMFWQLWAAGCWSWTIAAILGVFSPLPSSTSNLELSGLAFTFLPEILFMAALVMQPEIADGQLRDPVVRYEAVLLALWWMYLYAVIVSPWHWLRPDVTAYLTSFYRLHAIQNGSVALWLMVLWLAAKGPWRRLYGHLTGAFSLLAISISFFFRTWNSQKWLPAMFLQAFLVAAFLWISRSALIPTDAEPHAPAPKRHPTLGAGAWLASIMAIGVPLLALWSSLLSTAPEPVRRFRLLIFFVTLILATFLLYRWQTVAENQREGLVGEMETYVKELRGLQGQFAEAEKLASLGQLAAGAAHEINNPVAAMLGYSELLRSDPAASDRAHEFARKIGDQARRIRHLVQSLLSLAEQESREVNLLDVLTPLRGAMELRGISGGQKKQKLSLTTGEGPLLVRGDPEKLLQVFYRLLLVLSEDDAETGVDIRARNENGDRVIVEFTGFTSRQTSESPAAPAGSAYAAQRASHGKELSLNVCYSIVKDHGGAIARETLLDSAKAFRVELPAAGAGHPTPSPVAFL